MDQLLDGLKEIMGPFSICEFHGTLSAKKSKLNMLNHGTLFHSLITEESSGSVDVGHSKKKGSGPSNAFADTVG